MALPRVLLLATGGTIAMIAGADGGISPALDAHALAAAVPALAEVADLEVISFSNKPGASLTLQDLVQLATRIEVGYAQGCQGAVVVQGTDTIDETAFALELLVRAPLPVVVTGAMRGAAAPGADGPANLLAAVTVAATPAAAGLGVLVVLGDQVHAARHVQKSHTTQPSAFASPALGPLGELREGRLRLQARLTSLPAIAWPGRWRDAQVALLRIALDDDGRMMTALPRLGYHGAVIEAMGVGHVPGPLAPLLGELATRMPVILSTRVAAGPVLRGSYAFPGSEKDLLARGLVAGGMLGGLKARLLLRLLLATGIAPEDLPREFALRCDPLD
ncbi:MAG: asparaginase [Achromobacter sp.]|uniref:asparaginase n=1 Tax=Achromobacter sp. TaxID=134375 RepID=UPI003CFC0A7B